jgi:hypothetical protein
MVRLLFLVSRNRHENLYGISWNIRLSEILRIPYKIIVKFCVSRHTDVGTTIINAQLQTKVLYKIKPALRKEVLIFLE